MPKLTCECSLCMHHKDNCCCKPNVDVKGENATSKSDTFCNSFFAKGEGSFNSVAFSTENVDVNVACNVVKCKHKSGNFCSAPNVGITNSTATTMKSTVCSTFCCC